MKNNLIQTLLNWPTRIIRDADLASQFSGTANARHAVIKRATAQGILLRLAKGTFFIPDPYGRAPVNRFEIAQTLYGPSYVSFESALSYDGLIPEAVYTTTIATLRRTKEFHTPVGVFSYHHVPIKNFFLGVERKETQEGIFFMASPWRAIADHYFVFRRPWFSAANVLEDLRIEQDDLARFSREALEDLAKSYPSPRVRKILRKFL